MPLPKKPKQPVPKNAVSWCRAERHPCLRYFGAELYHQRWEKRGWSLSDLSDASGLSKSFLSELENGKKSPSEEAMANETAARQVRFYAHEREVSNLSWSNAGGCGGV